MDYLDRERVAARRRAYVRAHNTRVAFVLGVILVMYFVALAIVCTVLGVQLIG